VSTFAIMLTKLPLIDGFGRVHNNLRISVTDRCNIRCFYCMPAENVQFMDRRDLLSFEEIHQIVRAVVPLGIQKIRLTGGEPLVRRDLSKLVRILVETPGIEDVGLTTNGILLADQAQALFDAGLRRLNISLDALTPEGFREFTRRDGFEQVMEGIQAAQQLGFQPIKLNAVSVKGLSEREIVPFGEFARKTGIEVRFIEYMPLDADNAWERDKVLFAEEILKILADGILPLRPIGPHESHAPAADYVFDDGVGKIGVIASVSQPFCASCNRVRLTADGKLRNCLFSLEETDLRRLLRESGEEVASSLQEAFRQSIAVKKGGHEINSSQFVQPLRPMYSIGG